jgi:glutamyl-tRNA synthetase
MSSTLPVRVRFCPSPTGDLQVGNVRTALYNYAFARHAGGLFVFRVEDTDAARDSEESYEGLLDVLRWLGLNWDEGPEVGGPYGPYRQSERTDIYREVVGKLRDAGYVYESFSTPEEVQARHVAAGRNPKLGYDNYDRELTGAQVAAFHAEGRPAVLRFRMPDETIAFHDLIRGDTSFEPENVPDYALMRGDGSPLYPLTNPVDDALHRITHVLRGEDLLSSTPRQIPLHRALRDLGLTDAPMPEFGHLPFVLGEGNVKLSKRKPENGVKHFRDRGFVQEGLLNYLALLGWAISDDNDVFSMDEMFAAFDIADVNANSARFDLKKCEAINATWIRRLEPADFAGRLVDHLRRHDVIGDDAAQTALVTAAAPLVQERIVVLDDAAQMLAFLLVDDAEFAVDPAAAKQLDQTVLQASIAALEGVADWSATALEEALRAALIDGLALKPRKAFGPVRAAVTGRTVSPPLFESLELLGRDRSLARLRAAAA